MFAPKPVARGDCAKLPSRWGTSPEDKRVAEKNTPRDAVRKPPEGEYAYPKATHARAFVSRGTRSAFLPGNDAPNRSFCGIEHLNLHLKEQIAYSISFRPIFALSCGGPFRNQLIDGIGIDLQLLNE